jgi:hypothetical protein
VDASLGDSQRKSNLSWNDPLIIQSLTYDRISGINIGSAWHQSYLTTKKHCRYKSSLTFITKMNQINWLREKEWRMIEWKNESESARKDRPEWWKKTTRETGVTGCGSSHTPCCGRHENDSCATNVARAPTSYWDTAQQASKQASKQAYQDSITKGAGTHINLLTSRHIVAMVSIDGEPKIAHSVEIPPQQ